MSSQDETCSYTSNLTRSQTRHGRKTAARGFDGYKGHLGIDPDSEIITATTVSAGNAGDASVAEQLIGDLIKTDPNSDTDAAADERADGEAADDTRAADAETEPGQADESPRFHRTLAQGWAFHRFYNSETARRKALPAWLHEYNHHHTAIGKVPPINHLTNVPGQYT